MVATCVASLVLFFWLGDAPRQASDGPLSPEESQRHFDIVPGWTIELVAAEPMVVDPVALCWDERGRLMVAEMSDYPMAPAGGRIRILRDTDGDGHMDEATVFADKLSTPNGVLPYRGGILITAAPDILFLKDNDGDGKADQRDVVLTGFNAANQQLRVNGLTWGLDGWVYGANGRNGGVISSPKRPNDKPLNIDRRDFRFRPDTGEVQLIAGFSQFGQTFDAFGERFTNWNTVPFRHVVLPIELANRNAHFVIVSESHALDEPTTGSQIFPKASLPSTFNREPPGYFNASCGIAIDKGGVFPEADAGSAFVCEPLFSLVHRRHLRRKDSTFEAIRPSGEKDREFLTSRDPWFRPVFCASGPDGALYIADFYRQWVEHPDFVREDLRQGVEWTKGNDCGRIWRVRPTAGRLWEVPDFTKLSAADHVREVSHPNGWRRETARRLLVEQPSPETVGQLRKRWESENGAIARVGILAALEQCQSLDDATLASALHSDSADVRAFALRVLCARSSISEELSQELARLASDPAAHVRLQVVIASPLMHEQSPRLLVEAMTKNAGDPWIRQAVLASINPLPGIFTTALAEKIITTKALRLDVLIDVAESAARITCQSQDEDQLQALDTWLAQHVNSEPAALPRAIVLGMYDGWRTSGREQPSLIGGRSHQDWLRAAREWASDPQASPLTRRQAAHLLAHDRSTDSIQVLGELLADESIEVTHAALSGLRRRAEPEAVSALLESWAPASTSMKREILAAIFQSPQRLLALLEQIEKGDIAPSELDPDQRRILLEKIDPSYRARAEKVLAASSGADRSAVVKDYLGRWPVSGEATRGAQIFAKHCASCHRFQGQGHRIGPELSGLLTKSREQLLDDILDPNKQSLPDYIAIAIVTKDGLNLTGLVAAEAANSIVLRRAEGAEDAVLRKDIEELRSTGRSLMPEGFEQQIPPDAMADLIAYLRGAP